MKLKTVTCHDELDTFPGIKLSNGHDNDTLVYLPGCTHLYEDCGSIIICTKKKTRHDVVHHMKDGAFINLTKKQEKKLRKIFKIGDIVNDEK